MNDDALGLTAEQLAEMRPTREVLTEAEYAAVTGRSRPKTAKAPARTTAKEVSDKNSRITFRRPGTKKTA